MFNWKYFDSFMVEFPLKVLVLGGVSDQIMMLGNLMYRPPLQRKFRFEDSTGWWFQTAFMFTPKLGKMNPCWLIFFKRGWFNHQPVLWFQDKRILIPRIFSCSWVALKYITVTLVSPRCCGRCCGDNISGWIISWRHLTSPHKPLTSGK